MSMVMQILAGLTGVASLICWIMILIHIFKSNVGLGILGLLCGLFAFIYGWIKVEEFQAKKVMLIWTIAIVVGLVANLLGGGAAIKQLMDQMPAA